MFKTLGQLNYFSIILCLAVNLVLGIIWYMPFLFGNVYSYYTGLPVGGPPNPINLSIGIISGFVLIVALAILLKLLNIKSLIDAIIFALLVCIGIIFAVNLPINRFNDYPLGLLFIDSGMPVVSVIIDSIILFLMK